MAKLNITSLKEEIALETIKFQSPIFFKELTVVFSEMKKLKKGEIADSEYIITIPKIVKNYTGIKINFETNGSEPFVSVPKLDKNNPLVNNYDKEYLQCSDGVRLIKENDDKARGLVNLDTGKVSGVFSELLATVSIPEELFYGTEYSAEEIAAITLHEIGHLLVYYLYVSRSVSTNQALAIISQKLLNSKDISEKEIILTTIKDKLKLKELDAEALAKSTNNKVIETVVVTNLIKQTESELGSNIYDFSSWEYLADQYATRMGAGRYIVTSLSKQRNRDGISFRPLSVYLILEAMKLILLFSPLFEVGLIFIAMDGVGDAAYDRPGARFKRVRNQIVENMKLDDITDETRERLNEDLKVIDSVMEKVNDRRQFLGVVWDTLVPYARKAYKQEKLQKELENIAANELFVKASELKQMA